MNDYIIAVDRDGQPYIAHAWGQRGANANHKYIAKIGEGAKARYFYTQEQLRAFQQGARQGAQNTINQAKQKTSSLSNKLGEKTGISQRKQFKEAQTKAMKTGKGQDWDKANSTRDKYESTKLGKAESKAYKTKSAVENKAWDAVNKVKDKVEDTSENLKARRNVKKLDKEIKEERSKLNNIGNLEGQRKIKDLEIKKLEEQTKYDKSPETIAVLEKMKEARKKQDERIKKIEEAKSQSDSSKQKSKFSEYTKGDKDFDDKNFAEKNRVGDSDFFMAKRPDGSTVILEEDMKWVLPKGVNPNDPAIKRALTKEYKAGSNEEWVKQVTEAIDDAVEEANKKK